jgi:hypothetical protein
MQEVAEWLDALPKTGHREEEWILHRAAAEGGGGGELEEHGYRWLSKRYILSSTAINHLVLIHAASTGNEHNIPAKPAVTAGLNLDLRTTSLYSNGGVEGNNKQQGMKKFQKNNIGQGNRTDSPPAEYEGGA